MYLNDIIETIPIYSACFCVPAPWHLLLYAQLYFCCFTYLCRCGIRQTKYLISILAFSAYKKFMLPPYRHVALIPHPTFTFYSNPAPLHIFLYYLVGSIPRSTAATLQKYFWQRWFPSQDEPDKIVQLSMPYHHHPIIYESRAWEWIEK